MREGEERGDPYRGQWTEGRGETLKQCADGPEQVAAKDQFLKERADRDGQPEIRERRTGAAAVAVESVSCDESGGHPGKECHGDPVATDWVPVEELEAIGRELALQSPHEPEQAQSACDGGRV